MPALFPHPSICSVTNQLPSRYNIGHGLGSLWYRLVRSFQNSAVCLKPQNTEGQVVVVVVLESCLRVIWDIYHSKLEEKCISFYLKVPNCRTPDQYNNIITLFSRISQPNLQLNLTIVKPACYW
jgi:hypothetical protein